MPLSSTRTMELLNSKGSGRLLRTLSDTRLKKSNTLSPFPGRMELMRSHQSGPSVLNSL